MNKVMKKVVQAATFTAIIGISILGKFSNQFALAEETQTQMLDICAVDDTCVRVVDVYFEECFNTYYSMVYSYSSALDLEGLANCINQYGGRQYFAVE